MSAKGQQNKTTTKNATWQRRKPIHQSNNVHAVCVAALDSTQSLWTADMACLVFRTNILTVGKDAMHLRPQSVVVTLVMVG
ncbi:hypothetical protein BaRGS_00011801 [Batillaria attramentaria]|uniref:Uncharacterized protein n=1 Tax=Batillaria attramentaria TaxID=370345 RepID=A0ABD0LBY5_9CAEN